MMNKVKICITISRDVLNKLIKIKEKKGIPISAQLELGVKDGN